MKKFLSLLPLILAMFIFVSCVSDDDDIEETSDTGSDTSDESGNEGGTDTTADTAPSDPTGDHENPTDPSDPTAPSDPGDPGCKPNCEGKQCGSDGCGYDQMCNEDQTGCNTCATITLKDLVQTSSSDPANRFFDYTAEYSPNGGSSKNHFSFRIHNPALRLHQI